jgi:D-alanine-D-alanine ligase-like ATP-grasp enzyme
VREPFIRAILTRLAPRLRATVEFHEDGFVGRIAFANGAASLFWDNKFNLNPVSSAKVAQDKHYTSCILKKAGITVPEERLFFRPSARSYAGGERCGVRHAWRYAKTLGLPVFLKPNRLSQGRLVERVHAWPEFRRVTGEIFGAGRGMLVQRPVAGADYRLIVLDGAILSAYERRPLAIRGDGRATVRSLLGRAQRQFEAEGRDTVLDLDDERLRRGLERTGRSLASVPRAGEDLRLMDAANLSLGGITVDVTRRLHPTFADLARRVAVVMDLRFCGIDILAADATRPLGEYVVLEVNSAPGLDNYLFAGAKNIDYVDRLYLKVLRAVERGPTRGR